MLIEKTHIKNFIPQREPFLMIDELVSANVDGFVSTFQIEKENIFLRDGKLSEAALIENIAQTCAAGFGYLGSLESNEEPRLGFIGAVSKVEVFTVCQISEKVETKVSILNSFENIHLIAGVVKCNGVELVKCQMKIIQT